MLFYYGLMHRAGVLDRRSWRRLADLVESGMLERRRYSTRPPRDEYVLTARGRDFRPVLIAMMAWGNRHFADPVGPSSLLVDAETGLPADPILVDRNSGREIDATHFRYVAGPAADDEVRQRIAFVDAQREKT